MSCSRNRNPAVDTFLTLDLYKLELNEESHLLLFTAFHLLYEALFPAF